MATKAMSEMSDEELKEMMRLALQCETELLSETQPRASIMYRILANQYDAELTRRAGEK